MLPVVRTHVLYLATRQDSCQELYEEPASQMEEGDGKKDWRGMTAPDKPEEFWPHCERADADKLLETVEHLASEVGDAKIKQAVNEVTQQYQEAKKITAAPNAGVLLDMPEDVLDG